MSEDGRGLVENLGGAWQILLALKTPCLRRRRLRWGATDEELRRSFPGDALVPEPRWQYLHAITVKAPSSAVWPWVAQIGQGRGGFYSYERLESLAGCRIRNADAVIPNLQSIAVGDPVFVHPEMPPLTVAVVEPGHALVLHTEADLATPGGGGPDPPNLSWAFVVEDAPGGESRLFSRYRADYAPGWAAALSYGPWIVEPVSYAMDLKMLAGIKWRVERTGREA